MEHVLTQLILSDMRPIVSNFERPISSNGRKLADGRLQFCTLDATMQLHLSPKRRIPKESAEGWKAIDSRDFN